MLRILTGIVKLQHGRGGAIILVSSAEVASMGWRVDLSVRHGLVDLVDLVQRRM